MFGIKKLKQDKRGAALVYVLVTASMLILLGAATTSVAYANLKATQIQKEADNNFYNADGVINAIVGGLAEKASQAYSSAYDEVMASITEFDSTEALNAQFRETYLTNLKEALRDKTVMDESVPGFRYSVTLLKDYAELTFPDSFAYTVDAVGGNNYIDDYANGIILRNIHVLFEDDNGYYDEIITDIKMETPDPGLKSLPPNEDYFNALFVVDKGLDVASFTGANVYGDIYVAEETEDVHAGNALTLNNNSFIGVFPSEEAVLIGNTSVGDKAFLSFENWNENQRAEEGSEEPLSASYYWTENIEVGRNARLNMDGNIFVYDDLEVNGANSNIRLAGSYYGFSSSSDNAAESSSININGANTEIDLIGLNNMVLAGSSYIGTSTVDNGDVIRPGTSKVNIQTGEAFSVKSNQIAYLVDEREWSVMSGANDIRSFVSNPMSYVQYEAMLSANSVQGETQDAIWNNISQRITHRPLSCFGEDSTQSYSSFGECEAVAIFAPYDGDKNGQQGTVYIYIKYDNPDDASRFFSTLSKNNAEAAMRLRVYTEQYISKLAINPDTQFLVYSNFVDVDKTTGLDADGNFTYTDDSSTEGLQVGNIIGEENGLGYTILGGQIGSAESNAYRNTIGQIVQQAQIRYGTPDNPGASQKFKYHELISDDMVKDFITNAAFAHDEANNEIEISTFTNGVSIKGSTDTRAYIVDNAGGDPFVVTADQGLVIATGDVILKDDFIGSINCGGTLYLQGGSPNDPIVIQYDETIVSSVLYLYYRYGDPSSQMAVINVYQKYIDYEVNETEQEINNEDMIKNTISFSNWIKY